jgi:uncharacterized protein (DUF433 family)
MDWNGCDAVERVPGKVCGAPVIKGTRVQADAVLENYEAGESVAEIAYNFDLRPEDVNKVLAFAALHQSANPSR